VINASQQTTYGKHWIVKNLLLKTLLSILIGGLFIWLALRNVVWADLTTALASVDLFSIGGYFLLFTAFHLVRVHRWGLLLRPLEKVPFGRLFAVASVGYLFVLILPLRLGEFARPLLIADRSKIRVSAWILLGGLGAGLAALTLLAVLDVGLMIPAGPAMVGNFHFLIKLGLSFFIADSMHSSFRQLRGTFSGLQA